MRPAGSRVLGVVLRARMEVRVGRSLVSAARWSGVVGDLGGGSAGIVGELVGEVSEWLVGGEGVEIDTLGFRRLEVFGGRWLGGEMVGGLGILVRGFGGCDLCEC